jgi:hypothetical protein
MLDTLDQDILLLAASSAGHSAEIERIGGRINGEADEFQATLQSHDHRKIPCLPRRPLRCKSGHFHNDVLTYLRLLC